MTKLTRKNTFIDGIYIIFSPSGATYSNKNRMFARFKYSKTGMSKFLTFLIQNFTAEEYFERMESPNDPAKRESPMAILESKGYDAKKRYKREVTATSILFDDKLQELVTRLRTAGEGCDTKGVESWVRSTKKHLKDSMDFQERISTVEEQVAFLERYSEQVDRYIANSSDFQKLA